MAIFSATAGRFLSWNWVIGNSEISGAFASPRSATAEGEMKGKIRAAYFRPRSDVTWLPFRFLLRSRQEPTIFRTHCQKNPCRVRNLTRCARPSSLNRRPRPALATLRLILHQSRGKQSILWEAAWAER